MSEKERSSEEIIKTFAQEHPEMDTAVELVIQAAKACGIEWAYIHVCCSLDAGDDPRDEGVEDVVKRGLADMDREDYGR